MRGFPGAAALVVACLFSLGAQAACTQADLDERLSPALQYRLRCLDGVGRLDVFRSAATPHTQRISEARIGSASPKQAVTIICRETEALIAIADDVLTGGDGLGEIKKAPWRSVTPDDVLARRNEVMGRCKGQLPCYQKAMEGHAKEISALDGRVRMGRISAVEYIEATHGVYVRVLEGMPVK
ncbi:hypothetical protein LJC19_07280 [Oxalobacter sp. OttesenSCG-928-P03]|nr:hypothetical protein [Oxalobacter sp. OttesenSCG-928-P03]